MTGQPVLEWSRVATAVEYEVQVSASDNFGSFLYNATTENSRATPPAKLPSGTDLYWRVRGVTSGGAAGSWSFGQFAIVPDAAPTLEAPEDGADLQQPGQPPLLSWDPVEGATGYVIEVDNDDQFVGATSYTSKVTSFLVPDPGPELTYFWRVRATFDGGYTGDWSDARSFNILALAAPELVSPDDSSTTEVQDAVLDWAPVAGAVKYEVTVSTDDQFNSLVDTATVKSTWYARAATLDNDQYWWRVRAIDVNDNKSPWSTSLNQFQRIWPDQPNLVYPEDESTVGVGLYYEWDPIPHASEYRLEVARDPSFSPTTFDICTTQGTTFAVSRLTTTCSAKVEGTYYWRVRGQDRPSSPAINGVWSEIHSFYYDPATVEQVSPGMVTR